MEILQIEALPNGAHDNAIVDASAAVPEGWAYMPEGSAGLENFPFGNVTTEPGMTPGGSACEVLKTWTPGAIPVPPEPEPVPDPEPSELDKVKAQVLYTAAMTDTLLEDDEEEEAE